MYDYIKCSDVGDTSSTTKFTAIYFGYDKYYNCNYYGYLAIESFFL